MRLSRRTGTISEMVIFRFYFSVSPRIAAFIPGDVHDTASLFSELPADCEAATSVTRWDCRPGRLQSSSRPARSRIGHLQYEVNPQPAGPWLAPSRDPCQPHLACLLLQVEA